MLLTNRFSRIIISTWKVDLIMIASCIVAYFAHYYLISKHFDVPTIVPTVLGTAIAFFIGFNNNQAYDRWWEARRIWGGLVNDSRTWARDILSYINEDENTVELKQNLIKRHIAFLYLLKNGLRTADEPYYKIYLSELEIDKIDKQTNKHNAVLQLQSQELQKMYNNKLIDGYKFLQLDTQLVKFTDQMGMSERIKNTVFPTTYSYLTKMFIWLFVVAVELVIVQSAGVWSIFISWLIGFVFVSTQINGMKLINPFEKKPAAIPLDQITRTIEINLLQMMNAQNIPGPVMPVNGEYIL